MQTHMKKELVMEALNQAIGRYRPAAGMLLHSDRGSQYCSNKYQEIIKKNGFICSMSRKGNCWDNAPMESFWGKLKSEWLSDKKLKTIEEAKAVVFEYIEIFYNRDRLHSSNDYICPSQKREALLLVKAALVSGVHFILDKMASGIIADIFLLENRILE